MSDFKTELNSSLEEDELDALIADTNLLIESVHDMLERPRPSPPSPVIPMTRPRSHNSSDSSGQLGNASFNSPKMPPSCSTSATTTSTPSSKEIDREITRNNFCELLEHNLRSATVEQDEAVEKRLRLTLPSSPQDKTKKISLHDSGLSSNVQCVGDKQKERFISQSTISVRSPTPVEIIDLSDSIHMPVPVRASYPLNVSDDVICISQSDYEVIDLSTPTFCRNNTRARNNNYNRMPPNPDSNVNHTKNDNATRRSLVASRRLYSTDANRSSSRRSLSSFTSTSATNIGAAKEHINTNNKKNPNWVPDAHCDNSNGSVAIENERTPFMCPVCMESCVNNEPTSTKCGHVFCARCIREALRLTHKCPMCNKKLKPNMVFRIYI